jgi:hypothetical protein
MTGGLQSLGFVNSDTRVSGEIPGIGELQEMPTNSIKMMISANMEMVCFILEHPKPS